MNSIRELDSDLTLIIIAHRITTLSHADQVIQLEHGKITYSGPYEGLSAL